ncbi:MAG: Methyltransferase domain [Idiomarinaceae bacterium HL-53]|nr:MAG: Methyltransferase domain [Idiomarinaceae bacterium HL-53]CUS48030.1 Methyltransferase domain-containing protein [Idiomarinaceae bacterium HL-53]
MSSIQYYNQNAVNFHIDTINVDMSAVYAEFLPRLVENSCIIDAGCGSGRDAIAFKKLGFQVIAFDASEALVKVARKKLGSENVSCSTFLEFSYAKKADAIWACASLLHVPKEELSRTFIHLAQFLRAGGLFYCSFKYGTGQRVRGERTFTDMTEVELEKVLTKTGLTVKKTWVTRDARPDRTEEFWLNALLEREDV